MNQIRVRLYQCRHAKWIPSESGDFWSSEELFSAGLWNYKRFFLLIFNIFIFSVLFSELFCIFQNIFSVLKVVWSISLFVKTVELDRFCVCCFTTVMVCVCVLFTFLVHTLLQVCQHNLLILQPRCHILVLQQQHRNSSCLQVGTPQRVRPFCYASHWQVYFDSETKWRVK